MKSSKNTAQLIFKICLVTALLFGGAFFVYNNFKSTPQNKKIKSAHEQAMLRAHSQQEKDKTVLAQHIAGQPTGELEFYGALIRTAQFSDVEAQKIALTQINHKSSLIRQAVAQSLAYYNDSESLSALRKLSTDADPKVRQFALQSFGAQSSPQRTQILKELSQNKNSNDMEVLAIHVSLYQSQEKPIDEKNSLNNIVKLTRSTNKELASEAVRQLIQVAPNEVEVISIVQNAVHKNWDERLTSLGIRYLSNKKDPWITKNLFRLSKSKSSKVRMAVIQSLHRSCPANRWDVLKLFVVNDPDISVVDLAFRESLLMPGRQAKEFLHTFTISKTLPTSKKKIALETLAQLNANKQVNPCN